MRQFFGSMETLCNRNRSGGFLTPLPRSSISKSASRKFSTVHKVDTKMSQKVDIEVSNADRIISKTLSPEEMMKMEFYSKFSPTSVTLSHFLDHSSGGGTVEDSFLFLRREIPVRLANMMMELEVGGNYIIKQRFHFLHLFLFFAGVASRAPQPAGLPGDPGSVRPELQGCGELREHPQQPRVSRDVQPDADQHPSETSGE